MENVTKVPLSIHNQVIGKKTTLTINQKIDNVRPHEILSQRNKQNLSTYITTKLYINNKNIWTKSSETKQLKKLDIYKLPSYLSLQSWFIFVNQAR